MMHDVKESSFVRNLHLTPAFNFDHSPVIEFTVGGHRDDTVQISFKKKTKCINAKPKNVEFVFLLLDTSFQLPFSISNVTDPGVVIDRSVVVVVVMSIIMVVSGTGVMYNVFSCAVVVMSIIIHRVVVVTLIVVITTGTFACR
ncbi:hypothetical protein BDC45DRAFT_535796 [Circinella umbellata]|nr:hypothetical protein BDC45DRAFT_535796 [Circinella umbellata]